MEDTVYYIGLDVHKETISVAVFKGMSKEVEFEKTISNNLVELKKVLKKFYVHGMVHVCYEAGSLGYTLKRYLDRETDVHCEVISPGNIPKASSCRIKTDRRDARNLAMLLRSGHLTPIYVPSPEDEAVREYIRARGSVQKDIRKLKQRILQFLLRNGYRYETNRYWTQKHRTWMNAIKFHYRIQQEAFDGFYSELVYLESRKAEMDRRIQDIAGEETYHINVSHLRCLKGVDHLTAMAIISEIGDFKRFATAKAFMAYLGLVPREYSSGETVKRGGITKTGNAHLRVLLTEASWHYVKSKGSGKRVVDRRKDQDLQIISYAECCEKRLRRKYMKMISRGKTKQVAITAVSRELSGFIWGIMTGNIYH